MPASSPIAATLGRAFLALLLLMIAAPTAQAQPATRSTTAESQIEKLQRQQAAAADRGDIDEATKARIDGAYKSAIADVTRAKQLKEDIDALPKATVDGPAQVVALERQLELEQLRGARPEALPPADALSADEISRRVTEARLARDRAQQAVDALERTTTGDEHRPTDAARQRDEVQSALTRLQAEGSSARLQGTALAEATQARRTARIAALRAELEWLDREAAYLPTLVRINQLKLDLARLELTRRNAELQAWLDALAKKHQEDVDQARAAAAQAEATLEKHAAAAPKLAAENAELKVQLAQATAQLDRALRELSALRTRAADLEVSRRNVERAAEGRRLGAESSERLLELLDRLPTFESVAKARAERAQRLQAALASSLRAEREVGQLADLQGAVATAVQAFAADVHPEKRAALEDEIRGELARRRALLLRIGEQQRALVQALRQAEAAEEELLARAGAARNEALSLLLWIPLNAIGVGTLTDLPQAVGWMLSAENWRQVYAALAAQVDRWRLPAALALLVIAALYSQRGRWKRRLAELAPAAVSIEDYRIGHTLLALALTLLLAVPGALVFWLIGSTLRHAPGATPFVLSISAAFVYIGFTFLTLYGFSWLFDPRGVGVRHFRWPAEAMGALQRTLRRLMLVYIPLVFVAVANGQHAPFVNRESVGRLAFVAAMFALAVFLWSVFRPASAVLRDLMPEDSRRWIARLRPYWAGFFVLVPIALAVLSATGFHLAAFAMFALIRSTLLVVLAAVIVYGLISLWVLVQRARLSRHQAAALAASGTKEEPGAGRPVSAVQQLDVSRLSDQSRRLLNLLTTATLLAGLWLIWGKALPLFDVLGDVELWRYAETVDGEQVSGTINLGTVALAILILIVTYVGMRNIGAVLDMALLQRLDLQKDATYAIKTVSRYVIVGVGLVLASNTLHISWDRLQWLVAALGVGLGFGLQEIVANFVSGLIVLGERPIRIGDVVTVGDVTGTITRIRARATVVTDWDNKEIMIPNKAFITEHVINWTLSSQTTRLLVKVGVAYGSDTAKAQRVMLDAVMSIPEVLKEPSPSVYFLGFGESSLDFEIRAFVDSFDKRLSTLHAIHFRVEQALRANHIEIPFPQRDLHVRSVEGLVAAMPTPTVPDSGAGGT